MAIRMTTVHAFTNDQITPDPPHEDRRRARAASLSMIPTPAAAARAVGRALPELEGALDGFALRVPAAEVSVVDLSVQLKAPFAGTPSWYDDEGRGYPCRAADPALPMGT